jgi:fused signal recognition particle receptor
MPAPRQCGILRLLTHPVPPSQRQGFIDKLRSRLNKGKTWLSKEFAAVRGKSWDESSLEELEDRLLSADVGVDATEWLMERLRKPPHGRRNLDAIQLLELAMLELLEPVEQVLEIPAAPRPFVVLVVGVNGTGKTTTIGKLASRFASTGHTVVLAAGDTFRAAAVEQLGVWARRAGADFMAQAAGADPAAVIFDALSAARSRGTDVVIADTAGRLHTAGGLMDELKKVKRVISRFDAAAPHETLLVLDAGQGQNALAQATEFKKIIDISGLAVTKLDGSAKGGILLAIAKQLAIPVRYLGVGEAIDDLVPFHARDFVSALLQDGTT